MRHKNTESSQWRFMVSDWGLASIKQQKLNAVAGLPLGYEVCERTFNNMGTIYYMAPERFIQGYRSSLASDMFSLGMIYLEMLIGRLPLSCSPRPVEELLSLAYYQHSEAMLRETSLATSVRQLILSMVCPDPRSRPSSYQQLISACHKSKSLLQRIFT
jgi:serine/threonine protein kinase